MLRGSPQVVLGEAARFAESPPLPPVATHGLHGVDVVLGEVLPKEWVPAEALSQQRTHQSVSDVLRGHRGWASGLVPCGQRCTFTRGRLRK